MHNKDNTDGINADTDGLDEERSNTLKSDDVVDGIVGDVIDEAVDAEQLAGLLSATNSKGLPNYRVKRGKNVSVADNGGTIVRDLVTAQGTERASSPNLFPSTQQLWMEPFSVPGSKPDPGNKQRSNQG